MCITEGNYANAIYQGIDKAFGCDFIVRNRNLALSCQMNFRDSENSIGNVNRKK